MGSTKDARSPESTPEQIVDRLNIDQTLVMQDSLILDALSYEARH